MEGQARVRPDGTPEHPGFIERTLRRLAGDEVAESAWGDLEEEAGALSSRYGRAAARLWISLQGLRLILGWVDRNVFSPERWFGEVIMDRWSDRHRRLAALVGLVAVLPAAALVVGGLLTTLSENEALLRVLDTTLFDLDGFFYQVVLHPVTVLGGLALALALNLIPLLRIDVEGGAETARATIALRLRHTHLAIAAGGLALLALILGYSFTENFDVVPREPAQSAAPAAPAAVAVGAGWTAVRRSGGEWNVRRIDGDEAGVVAPFLRLCRWRQILQIESPDPSAPAEIVVPDTLCWQVVPN